MGLYRQLVRRPALPFLFLVSCALISSPLWRTKQVGCWCFLGRKKNRTLHCTDKRASTVLHLCNAGSEREFEQPKSEAIEGRKPDAKTSSAGKRLWGALQLEEACYCCQWSLFGYGQGEGSEFNTSNMFECHILIIFLSWNILGELFVTVQSGKHLNTTRWAFLREQKLYLLGSLLKHAKL